MKFLNKISPLLFFGALYLFMFLVSCAPKPITNSDSFFKGENNTNNRYYVINQYSGGIMVNTWTTSEFSAGNNKVYFTDKTSKHEMTVMGEFTIEQYK